MSAKVATNRRPRLPLKCEREGREQNANAAPEETEPDPVDSPLDLVLPHTTNDHLKLQLCVGNPAHGIAWLRALVVSHPDQFATIQAILAAVVAAEGGDITQESVIAHSQQVADYVREKGFAIIPRGGCLMQENGDGIRHAKYSPSKNIAVLWLRVGRTIFYTFDDHGGVTFHRAIFVLQRRKHGQRVSRVKQRTPQWIVQQLARRDLTVAQRKAYERSFQLNGTLASFRKLKEPRRKYRISERELREPEE